MSPEQAAVHGLTEQSMQSLKTRNAELMNSNQLLLDELTECRRAMAALRENAGVNRRLMESNVLGIMIARAEDAAIIEANDLFLKMLGYTREDLRGRKISWHNFCPSPEALDRCLNDGIIEPTELQFVKKSGEKSKLLFTADCTIDQQHIVGFMHSLPA